MWYLYDLFNLYSKFYTTWYILKYKLLSDISNILWFPTNMYSKMCPTPIQIGKKNANEEEKKKKSEASILCLKMTPL